MDALGLGTFPFGRPNSPRPMRRAPSGARALVVGVYPSAFHVAWTPPPEHDPREESARARRFIAALAVDVEPIVFWDGVEPDPAELLARWVGTVGFDSAFGTVHVGPNGPSGAGVTREILQPLGLTPDAVAFTDAVPWFFVKPGNGGQAEAISQRFAPIARLIGATPGTLPARPSPRKLVELARSEMRRETFQDELLGADTPLIITLGQEALDSVVAVCEDASGMQPRLAPSGYGTVGQVRLRGRTTRLVPLVHPGFQRQTNDPLWREAFALWTERAHRLDLSE